MRISIQIFTVLITFLFSTSLFAQKITLSGVIRNSQTKETVPAASVIVKGTGQGTYTSPDGAFSLNVSKLPVVLVFTSVGFDDQEVNINEASTNISVDFKPVNTLGQEVVVSANRVPEKILESPVTIDRMSSNAIRNVAVPNYYEALSNIKGVDMTTSGLNFRTLSTRGFNGSGNLRFNQLVDGMDNQAPALNFAVGSVIGLTELDADNAELLSGASSALYGSGGQNGTLLINSKNPFKYQGLSLQIKQGINHTDKLQRKAAPFYDWSLRWGKKVSEKFAFKLSGSLTQAQDWQATDTRNLQRNNVNSSLKAGTRQTDPNYDGVNVFGDEASASMAGFAQAAIFGLQNTSLSAVASSLAMSLGRAPTPAEIVGFYAAQTNPAYGPLPIFAKGLGGNLYGGQLVSRTGYDEKDLADYNSYNVKLSGGAYYNITNAIEASIVGYWGMGTTVYTGADRYALRNFKIGQYKAEIKSADWFLRAYTTQENSGDSYTATTAALFINRAWRSDADWFGTYSANYAGARLAGAPDANAHAAARNAADAGRLLPGTDGFKAAFENAKSTDIKNAGARFADQSDLFHYEGQWNLAKKVKFIEPLIGASYRTYKLNSRGTIFADTTGPLKIAEFGGYLQLQKRLLNDVLKLSASIRYDKRDSYDGRFTPRATATIRVAKNNHVRLSFQTAYRFPSTQDQWINLNTPGSRLIGGDPSFITYFNFNGNPTYTSESIVAYRSSIAAGTPNPTLLKKASFNGVKPETAKSYELGYKGLITSKLLVDAYVYYSNYKNFISRVAVGRGSSGDPAKAPTDLASPFTTNNFSFVTNTSTDVKAIGWGVGLEYQAPLGFKLSANASGDQLNNVPAGFVAFFNTPKIRCNVGLSNTQLGAKKNIGFNIMFRWQDEVNWEGTFGTGPIPSYSSLDAQVSYKMIGTASTFKLGASNMLNKYYSSAFGNPQIGGLYYISYAYNIF